MREFLVGRGMLVNTNYLAKVQFGHGRTHAASFTMLTAPTRLRSGVGTDQLSFEFEQLGRLLVGSCALHKLMKNWCKL